jgi:hypothetical protein
MHERGSKRHFPLLGRSAAAVILLSVSAACFGETYKWLDDRGVTTYGTRPPPGRAAQRVDTQPQGPVDRTPDPQPTTGTDARRSANVAPPPPMTMVPPPSPPSKAAVRGMPFDTFIRLERGMSEGELVLRAGAPDYAAVDEAPWGYAKLYYYLPTATDPFTTVVTLRGGRIENLERTRKF